MPCCKTFPWKLETSLSLSQYICRTDIKKFVQGFSFSTVSSKMGLGKGKKEDIPLSIEAISARFFSRDGYKPPFSSSCWFVYQLKKCLASQPHLLWQAPTQRKHPKDAEQGS